MFSFPFPPEKQTDIRQHSPASFLRLALATRKMAQSPMIMTTGHLRPTLHDARLHRRRHPRGNKESFGLTLIPNQTTLWNGIYQTIITYGMVLTRHLIEETPRTVPFLLAKALSFHGISHASVMAKPNRHGIALKPISCQNYNRRFWHEMRLSPISCPIAIAFYTTLCANTDAKRALIDASLIDRTPKPVKRCKFSAFETRQKV